MKSLRIKFPNAEGHELAARLDLPIDQKPRVCAIFAHCFTCSKDLSAVKNISLALTQKGVAVFRFDFTGLGQSEGEFGDTNFSSNVADLIAAADYLSKEFESPQLLIGHSLGGAAVLLAGLKIDSVRAVATIGAPADPMHVSHLIEGGKDEINAKGEASVNIGGRSFCIKKQFLEDLKDLASGYIKDLNKSLLVLHSPQDQIVGVKNAEQIYKAAMHPKSFVSLDGADHLLSNPKDAQYAGEIIASWAMRYVDLLEEDELKTERQVVVRTDEEGYLTEIKAGPHSFLADEPESVGGTNLGPSPYGYLTAALGACTSMTLRMYADRKKWDLKEVRVHLSHSKNYFQDSEAVEGKGGKIDIFDREIELEGNLDDEQKARLLEIADRCPVHRTLHSDIQVITRLAD